MLLLGFSTSFWAQVPTYYGSEADTESKSKPIKVATPNISSNPAEEEQDTITNLTTISFVAPVITSLETSEVEFRVPAEDKIKKYQEDSRFQYKEEKPEIPTWFARILMWLGEMISKLIGGVTTSGSASIIVGIAIIILIIVIIMKLAGVKFKALLGKKKLDTPEVEIYNENVHEMSFDTLINEALAKKDYRLAVRFLYLRNLKMLTDKGVIKWSSNKTNYSYQYEIRDSAVRSKFLETTFIFDYVWYGEFELDGTKYLQAQELMESLAKTMTR